MKRVGFEEVSFFVGTEVEKNRAFGERTLFVVGLQTVHSIRLSNRESSRHIYFGANDSFQPVNAQEVQKWVDMIMPFLKESYICTLDLSAEFIKLVADTCLVEHEFFQPVIKVQIPHVEKWKANTYVKVDDVDFNATNPGVWLHSLSSLMVKESFTSWIEFSEDAP